MAPAKKLPLKAPTIPPAKRRPGPDVMCVEEGCKIKHFRLRELHVAFVRVGRTIHFLCLDHATLLRRESPEIEVYHGLVAPDDPGFVTYSPVLDGRPSDDFYLLRWSGDHWDWAHRRQLVRDGKAISTEKLIAIVEGKPVPRTRG